MMRPKPAVKSTMRIIRLSIALTSFWMISRAARSVSTIASISGLEGLPVGAVEIIVALLVGGLRRNLLAEAGGFGAERAELGSALDDGVEGGQFLGRHQRAPTGQKSVDLVEVLHKPFGKRLGHFPPSGLRRCRVPP